jgi:hypothetical protein
MNYFKRRKILKRINFLDLRPVRILSHQLRDDGGVTLLLPRFKNKFGIHLFQSRSKEPYIRIKLDRFGSQAWTLIDGSAPVSEICSKLTTLFPGEFVLEDETETRVTNFLSRLYQERYITFREIQDQPWNPTQ